MPSGSGTAAAEAAQSKPPSAFGDETTFALALPSGWCQGDFEQRIQGIVGAFLCSHDLEEAMTCLREVRKESGDACSEQIVVSIVLCALERSLEQQKLLSDSNLLPKLVEDGVITRPALVWGCAKLSATWEELAVDYGSLAPPALLKMIVHVTNKGCLDKAFLRKMPKALLQSVSEAPDEAGIDASELQGLVKQLENFKESIDSAKLLQRRARPAANLMGLFVSKVSKTLKELGVPELHHEFVKWALCASLEWPPAERKQCIELLVGLRKQEVICEEDVQWAVLRMLGFLDELSKDIPDAAKVAREQFTELLNRELLQKAFLKKCQRLQIGDAAGLSLIEGFWPAGEEDQEPAEDDSKKAAAEPQEASEEGANENENDVDGGDDNQQEEDAGDASVVEPAESEDTTSGDLSTMVPTEGAPKSEADESENHDEPESTPAPATSSQPSGNATAAAAAPKAAVSLRPGGSAGGSLTAGLGLSLRPGGSGGLTGLALRPPTSATASNPKPNKENSNSEKSGKKGNKAFGRNNGGGGDKGGYPKDKEDGGSGGWRRDAAKTQERKQQQKDKEKENKQQAQGSGDATSSSKAAAVPANLVVTQDSWVAQQRKRREQGEVAKLSDEDVLRRMRSILNKLTLDKFDDLYLQLINCGISSEKHVRMLMVEVFEKATTQHHFVGMYTNMCVRLSSWFKENVDIGDFKGILLDQCQASFNDNMKRPAELAEEVKGGTADEQDELELKRHKWKTRMVGNIKLVGQLLIQDLVKSKVLIICAEELLAARTSDSMELLASLLSTVGHKFDVPAFKYHDALSKVFVQVKGLAQDPKALGSRPRCLLQDVLDLRAHGWEDTRAVAKQAAVPRARTNAGENGSAAAQ